MTTKTTTIAILVAITVLVPITASSVFANPPEDIPVIETPYTRSNGVLQTTMKDVDGFILVTKTFTSNELKARYGIEMLTKQNIIPNIDHVPIEESTKIQENVEFDVLIEKEGKPDRLTEHQLAKNNGKPMYTHEEWDIVPEIKKTRQVAFYNTAFGGWTCNVSSCTTSIKIDPVNLIFQETSSTGITVIVKDHLVTAGWSTSKGLCGGGDQKLKINGVWTQQDYQIFKTDFICDRWHMRLWEVNSDQAVGAAHYEDTHIGTSFDIIHTGNGQSTEIDVVPTHVVHNWEGAEDKVADEFGTGYTINYDNTNLHNDYTREYKFHTSQVSHVSATSNEDATLVTKN